MTITKLRIHGARVVRSVGVMVDHVKTGNDEELLKTIKEVCIEQSMKLVYFVLLMYIHESFIAQYQ